MSIAEFIKNAAILSLLTRPQAAETYTARSRIIKARNGELGVWGHSYAFGIGSTDIGKRYSALLSEQLRLRERCDAVSGTAVASDGSGASWVAVLQKITQPSRGAVAGSGVPATGERGYSSPGGIYTVNYGINDVNSLGNTASALYPVQEAVRLILSRMRAGAIYENSSSTFTYTGAWSTAAGITSNSGLDYRYTTSSSAGYTISTPADFPGGMLAIGLQSPSGIGNGATHNVSLNGATATSHAKFNTRTGSTLGHVIRIPNVPAGVNSILVTLSGVMTYTAVDYWQWEAPLQESPLILLLAQPLPVDYSAYGSVLPGPPTDAGVAALNQVLALVAAEFDERVLFVNLSALDKDASMFAPDKLHPSDKGHQLIAKLCAAAIRTGKFTVDSGQIQKPRLDYGTGFPTWTRTYYSVGDEIRNAVPIEAGTAGSKYITYGWVCTVEGRPGTWLPLRYLTGN